MWFRKPPDVPPGVNPLEAVEERLRVLSQRCDELEKAHRAIAMSMEDALDRMYHWMQRANARARAAQPHEPVDGAALIGLAGEGVARSVDAVSAKILARRARSIVPRGTPDEEEG